MPNATSQILEDGEQNAEKNCEISHLFFGRYSKIDAPSRALWNPTPDNTDARRNYKIARPQTGVIVIEPKEFRSISQLKVKKEKLSQELEETTESCPDKYYSLREEISKIEESIARSKHEFVQLNQQLDQVRYDLRTIDSVTDSYQRVDEKKRLLNEEKILQERLERRRGIFQ